MRPYFFRALLVAFVLPYCNASSTSLTASELYGFVKTEKQLAELIRRYIADSAKNLEVWESLKMNLTHGVDSSTPNIISNFVNIKRSIYIHDFLRRRAYTEDLRIRELMVELDGPEIKLMPITELETMAQSVVHTAQFYARTELLDQIQAVSVPYPGEWNTLHNAIREEEKTEMASEYFRSLCSIDTIYSTDVAPLIRAQNYKCWFTTPANGYAAFKTELLLEDPQMVLFHDIVSDTEVNALIQAALPKLQPSLVRTDKGQQITHAYRNAKTHILDNQSVTTNLEKRIAVLTYLDVENAELFSITNYPIGGEYKLHFDWMYRKDNSVLNDRIATVLIYLTDVAIGGATVFPELELAVKPQKGSALLFFNLLADGSPDYRTRHAGCPVLSGDKWIANKWIRENGQFRTRPCQLQPNDD